MKFFDPFWKADFYKNNETLSFWKGFFRLVLFSFFISIVFATWFYVSIGKNIPSYVATFEKRIIDGYPSDLVLTVKDGILSKNIVGELKLYPFSGDDLESLKKVKENNTFTHFVAIDDTKGASLDAFKTSSSVVFFGKDSLIAEGDNGIKMYPYTDLMGTQKEVNFSKEKLTYFVDLTHKFTKVLPEMITVGIAIFCTLFFPIGDLIVLLFIALIVMLLSEKVLKNKMDYKKAYLVSLYAFPAVFIIEKGLTSLPYLSSFFKLIPFFTTIIMILFLSYMFRDKHKTL